MDPNLDDLRFLRLAAMYERAYEGFVHESSKNHLSERNRLRLAPLEPERDDHEGRIRALIDALNARIPPEKRDAVERAVLMDIVEVERAAREFYLDHLDRAHDPAVVALFQSLAREEGRHVRIAEDALDAVNASSRREVNANDAEDFRMLVASDPPLWEGTTDLDRKHPSNSSKAKP